MSIEDSSLREWFGICGQRLGIEVDNVAVERIEAAAPFAEPGRVNLPTLSRAIVAHELAHIAQFRLSGWQSPEHALEAEADLAAAALLDGRPFQCRFANPAGYRQFWNRMGHYYTTYYLGMAAGGIEDQVRKMAFYCQLPDLVAEFDAPTQCEIAGCTVGGGALDGIAGVEPRADVKTIHESAMAIVRGLHCLTGRPAQTEQQLRVNNSMSASWNSLEFGVGLHALGDAWAHTNGATMYGPDYGHLFGGHHPDETFQKEVKSIPHTRTTTMRSGVIGHTTTYTYETCYHPSDRYKAYCNEIARIIYLKVPKISPVRMPQEEACRNLFALAGIPSDEEEVDRVKNMKRLLQTTFKGSRVTYEPSADCTPWASFATSESYCPGGTFKQVVDLAWEWSGLQRRR